MNDLNLEFCFTCLKVGIIGDKFVSLSFEPPEDISYKNKLKSCVPEMGLEDTDDCFLCKPCSAALETAYTFRCMCLRTETRLGDFRKAQNKNLGIQEKSIKQELIESSVVTEENSLKSTKLYSKEKETKELYPTTSKESEEKDIQSRIEENESKIEIVKNELGSLLSESLANANDINIDIFNEEFSGKFNSKGDIINSLNSTDEIKEIENGRIRNNKQNNTKNVDVFKKKPLSDAEIIAISCKRIRGLNNCRPEALECQVTLEKIEIGELPVIIKPSQNIMLKNKGKKAYWCNICKKDVYRKERFHAHILKHSNVRAYKCQSCKRGFFSSETLSKHKKTCNGIIVAPKTPKKKKIARKIITKKSSNNKIRHIKKKIKIEKDEDEIISNKETVVRKSTRQHTPSKKFCNLNDNIYRCKHCNYQSFWKDKYKSHLLRHNSDTQFSCSECSKEFYEKWELNRHIRNVHPQNKDNHEKNVTNNWDTNFLEPAISLIVNPGTQVVTPIIQSIHSLANTSTQDDSIEVLFSCKICKISFKSRNLLMLHTQTHEFNNKHPCEICQEEFNTDFDLFEHSQIHKTNESSSVELELAPKKINKKRKKFFCNICNMEFASRDHANVHTGAKPYTCQVCLKQFAAYTTLRKHKRTHQNNNASSKKRKRQTSPQPKTYSCEICKKKFVNKQRVYSHNCQNASGDSVYRCQICKNAFIGRSALIEHMGIHVSQNNETTTE